MGSTVLLTEAMDLLKARAVNCTDSSFDSIVPTLTEPAADEGTAGGRAAYDLANGGRGSNHQGQNAVLVFPFGAGNDDTTFDMRVFGWKLASRDGASGLWVPFLLAGFSCTLSAAVGAAGGVAVATDRFADTITRMTGLGSDLSSEIVSPANNTPGHVVVDLKGCRKFELSFDMTGATSGNALFAFL